MIRRQATDSSHPSVTDRQTNNPVAVGSRRPWSDGVSRANPLVVTHRQHMGKHMRLTKEAPATALITALHDTALASTSASCYTPHRPTDTTAPGHHPQSPTLLLHTYPLPIPRRLHARRKWLYVTRTARLDRRQRVAGRDSSHIPARQGCPLRLRCSARYALSHTQHFTCLLADDRSVRLPRWRPPLHRPHVGPRPLPRDPPRASHHRSPSRPVWHPG
jgi:hypothetical protein